MYRRYKHVRTNMFMKHCKKKDKRMVLFLGATTLVLY
jgi:hypothetical protein